MDAFIMVLLRLRVSVTNPSGRHLSFSLKPEFEVIESPIAAFIVSEADQDYSVAILGLDFNGDVNGGLVMCFSEPRGQGCRISEYEKYTLSSLYPDFYCSRFAVSRIPFKYTCTDSTVDWSRSSFICLSDKVIFFTTCQRQIRFPYQVTLVHVQDKLSIRFCTEQMSRDEVLGFLQFLWQLEPLPLELPYGILSTPPDILAAMHVPAIVSAPAKNCLISKAQSHSNTRSECSLICAEL